MSVHVRAAKRQTSIKPSAKCCRNAETLYHTIKRFVGYTRLSRLAHGAALAQELHLPLASAAGLEEWVQCWMVGVQVVNMRVAKFHDRVRVARCDE